MSEDLLTRTEPTERTGLTVDEIRESLDSTAKGSVKNSIKNCVTVFRSDPLFKDAIKHNILTERTDIVKPLGWQRLSGTLTDTDMVKNTIIPYFKPKEFTLIGLQPRDIQEFYTQQLKRVKASSVIHYHVIIHRALKYAVRTDLIPTNPADKIDRPKMERFIGSFYDSDEMNSLFEAAAGTRLELPILLGAFYGLRRSEVIGLKWDAIDFANETITIRHTVTTCNLDGKQVLVASDTTKTKSSLRTLPLVQVFKERLLDVKAKQEHNMKLCGRSYNKEYLGYICVDEMGNLLKPGYLTTSFPLLLEKNGLRKIRFHDLRHSCASLLLANGVPMKQIQEWLGHSDFSTTANIYAHLDFNSKISSAQAMITGLKLPEAQSTVGMTDALPEETAKPVLS